jgi:tetratricopeptide (TPR) repeat protein
MHRLSLAALALSVFFILPMNAFAADPAGRPASDPPASQPAPPAPLGGFSMPAPAQENLTGSEYLARAEESYLGGDYEKALDDFTKALPLLTDDADRARVHSRLAFVYSALDKPGEVYAEFLKSLKLDPGLTLERDLVSPQVYEAFLKARDEVIREGTLVCNCDPAGAEVYLDGLLLGEAPVRRDRIKEGEHVLILKKQGYETSVSRITIKKGVTLTIEDKMTQASGEISVGSEPPGAAIVLDGKEAGTTRPL